MSRWWPDPTPAGGPLPKGQHGKKPPPPKPDSNRRCPMVAAVRSARRGKWRLARRYVGWSARLMAATLA